MAPAMTTVAGTSTEDLFRRFGPNYRWMVTATVMIGAIAMGFATSMVNAAAPSVMGAFGVGLDQAQWISTGFLAIAVVSLLAVGPTWMIGRKRKPR